MITASHQPKVADVARHYDEVDPFYRELWGEHLHHGLWLTGDEGSEQRVHGGVGPLSHQRGIEGGRALRDERCRTEGKKDEVTDNSLHLGQCLPSRSLRPVTRDLKWPPSGLLKGLRNPLGRAPG